MARALVVHDDVVSRNLLRLALERRGLVVEVAPSLDALGADADLRRFVAIVVTVPDPARVLAVAARVADSGARLVLTSADPMDGRFEEVDGVDMILSEPLEAEDVEAASDTIVEITLSGRDVVDAGWNGALRTERKRLASELPGRVAALGEAALAARATRRPDALDAAVEVAGALAADAVRFRFFAVGEVCAELRLALQGMVDGRADPSHAAVWGRVDALLRLLSDAPVQRVLEQRTIDDAQLRRTRGAVLVVHPDLAVLLAAAAVAERHGLSTVSARTARDGVAALAGRRFEIALVDEALPEDGALQVVTAVRAAPGHAAVPIGLLTEEGRTVDGIGAALARAQAAAIVPLPLRERGLASLLAAAARPVVDPPVALWLGADGPLRRQAAAALAPEGVALAFAGGQVVAEALALHEPDLVLVDATTHPVEAVAACRALREDPARAALPVLLVTDLSGAPVDAAVAALGADGAVLVPLDEAALRSAVVPRIRRARTVRDVDPVSRARSRPSLLRWVRDRLAPAEADALPLALGLVDVHRFHDLNLRAGFDAGDRLLRLVADTLAEVVGEAGAVGRVGDDRFVVVAAVPVPALEQRLKRALQRVDAVPWVDALRAGDGPRLRAVTLAVPSGATDPARLVSEAERSLHAEAHRALPTLRRVLALGA